MNRLELKGIEALAKECFPKSKYSQKDMIYYLKSCKVIDNEKDIAIPYEFCGKNIYIFVDKNERYTAIYNGCIMIAQGTLDKLYMDIDYYLVKNVIMNGDV